MSQLFYKLTTEGLRHAILREGLSSSIFIFGDGKFLHYASIYHLDNDYIELSTINNGEHMIIEVNDLITKLSDYKQIEFCEARLLNKEMLHKWYE